MVEVEKSPASVKGRLGGVNKVFFITNKNATPWGGEVVDDNQALASVDGGRRAEEAVAHR